MTTSPPTANVVDLKSEPASGWNSPPASCAVNRKGWLGAAKARRKTSLMWGTLPTSPPAPPRTNVGLSCTAALMSVKKTPGKIWGCGIGPPKTIEPPACLKLPLQNPTPFWLGGGVSLKPALPVVGLPPAMYMLPWAFHSLELQLVPSL